jgi:hypothetical protein
MIPRLRSLRRAPALLLAAALAVPLVASSPATAGPLGTWTRVSGDAPEDIGIIARPSSVRTPDGLLHVVYTRQDDSSNQSLLHVVLGDDGEVLSRSTVVSGWDALSRDPEILLSGSGLRVVFSGLRDVVATDPFNSGRMYHATSDATGATWTLQPTYLSKSGFAYASNGTGAVDLADGSAMVAWTPSGTRVYLRSGEVADPEAASADQETGVDRCCVYDAELARVPGTDEVWASWVANGGTSTSLGVFVQRVAPTFGPVLRAPRSVVDYEGTESMSPLSGSAPLVATADGVYVAYPVGYPTRQYVGVWRVGDAAPTRLPASEDARYAALSVAPGGRLWAAWVSDDDVRAARSSVGVSRWGAAVDLGFRTVTGEPSSWGVDLDATGGTADVLLNDSTALWHQEALPGLTLAAAPDRLRVDRRTRVTFTVTDAGDPVAGAEVRLADERCTTAADGTCSVQVRPARARRLVATATLADHAPGRDTVAVRR